MLFRLILSTQLQVVTHYFDQKLSNRVTQYCPYFDLSLSNTFNCRILYLPDILKSGLQCTSNYRAYLLQVSNIYSYCITLLYRSILSIWWLLIYILFFNTRLWLIYSVLFSNQLMASFHAKLCPPPHLSYLPLLNFFSYHLFHVLQWKVVCYSKRIKVTKFFLTFSMQYFNSWTWPCSKGDLSSTWSSSWSYLVHSFRWSNLDL